MGFRKKPKGSAKLPGWWMEVTPHNVRDDHGIFPKLRSTKGGNKIRHGDYGETKKTANDASDHTAASAAFGSAPAPVEASTPAPAPAPAALGGPAVGAPAAVELGAPVAFPGPAPAAVGGPVVGAPAPVELGAPAPASVEVGAAPAPVLAADPSGTDFTVETLEEEIIEEEYIEEEYIEEEYVEEEFDTKSGSVEDLEQRLARKSAELKSLQGSQE